MPLSLSAIGEALDRRADPGHGLLAAKRRQRLEDARRDGAAGDRHPDRLVETAGLNREAIRQRG